MRKDRTQFAVLSASALAVPLLAGAARSGQAADPQAQAAAIMAQNEAAEIQPGDKNTDSSDYLRSIIGLRMSPMPLNNEHWDRLLVGLGSYLVNQAGGCNDDYISPSFALGHNPYLGQPKQANTESYLGWGHPFPAGETVVAPDMNRKSGRFELSTVYSGHSVRARSGQSEPTAASDAVAYLSEADARDLRAIYEYLSSIPSISCSGNAC